MYIRELSFVLENKSIFIVAGTCANNVRSLKGIHAWADLELPLYSLTGPVLPILMNVQNGNEIEGIEKNVAQKRNTV